MPSCKMRTGHNGSRNPLQSQGDSRRRVRLSRLLPATTSAIDGAYDAEWVMRRMALGRWSTYIALISLPKRRCRPPSQCRHISLVSTIPRRLRAPGPRHCSQSWKPPRLLASASARRDEPRIPHAFARRWSLSTEERYLSVGATRRATTCCSCPHCSSVRGWWATLAPTSDYGAPILDARPKRYRSHSPRRRRSEADCPVSIRSGNRVLPWMSVAGLFTAMAGLLAYMLASSSDVPTPAAWLAGITASAAAARVFLAVPAAIKALRDLRP